METMRAAALVVYRERLGDVSLGVEGRSSLEVGGGAGILGRGLRRAEGLVGMEAVERRLVRDGGGDVVYGGGRHCRPGREGVEAVGGIGREGEGVGMGGRGKRIRVREEAVELLGLDVAQQRRALTIEMVRGGTEEVCGKGVWAAISTGVWEADRARAAGIQPKGGGASLSSIMAARERAVWPARGGRTRGVSSLSRMGAVEVLAGAETEGWGSRG